MKVFIIAPFKPDPDFENKKLLILNLARSENMDVIFASQENREINANSSLSSLESSDFVIADLSFERPSCYFEVGFAQAKNKKVFLVASTNTTIHQVKSKSDVLFYKDLNEYEKIVKNIFKDQ